MKQEREQKSARGLPPEQKSSAADQSPERVQSQVQEETKDWNPSYPESSHRQVEEIEDLTLYAFKYWLPYFSTLEGLADV
jgi:hypothetical protein